MAFELKSVFGKFGKSAALQCCFVDPGYGQVALFDDGSGAGVEGNSSPVVIVSPPSTIINNDRPVPPAKWAPTIVIIIPVPGDPCRRPVITRNPIPAIIWVPMPSAVVVSKKSPGIKR
jgi:hypothetical protein